MRSRGTTSFKLKLKVKVATELATNYYTIVHLTLASNPLFINLYRLGFSLPLSSYHKLRAIKSTYC